jgi:hypothetical protein
MALPDVRDAKKVSYTEGSLLKMTNQLFRLFHEK